MNVENQNAFPEEMLDGIFELDIRINSNFDRTDNENIWGPLLRTRPVAGAVSCTALPIDKTE